VNRRTFLVGQCRQACPIPGTAIYALTQHKARLSKVQDLVESVRKTRYIADMSISSAIALRIGAKLEGEPFTPSEFLDDWPRTSVDQALSRMCRQRQITRIGRGIYVRGDVDFPQGQDCQTLLDKVAQLICRGDKAIPDLQADACITSEKSDPLPRFGYFSRSYRCMRTVLGSRIRVRRISARKIPTLSGRCGQAQLALWCTTTHQREEKTMKILDDLSVEEIATLSASGSQIPGWAKKAITNRLEDKPRATRPKLDWSKSSAIGRWSGFGPYYAMFPVEFARDVVEKYCPDGGTVLDPFCGRGTVPFVALATGRRAAGFDINPVAWIFAKTKTDPCPDHKLLFRRACEIQASITDEDRTPVNEFQELAWSPEVLGFLNSARRQLDWKSSRVDRTLMATLLVHLHAKKGEGLSNQMRQSKAMAPEYSVAWWKKHGMQPPEINVLQLLQDKLKWRYAKGIVRPQKDIPAPRISLGDNRRSLRNLKRDFNADLIFTSPPYHGVTNYRYDNWIRLWLLGEGPALPASDSWARHQNQDDYKELLLDTFRHCRAHSSGEVVVYVRTDARTFTLEATVDALRLVWPDKAVHFAFDEFKKPTQTALFGDKDQKPGEVDLLLVPEGRPTPSGFTLLRPGTYPKKK